MGTVAVAFFGGGDEPGKAIAAFGRFAVLSLFLAAILAYGLLPLANDFPSFLIVMGLFMLPIGMWAAANPMGVRSEEHTSELQSLMPISYAVFCLQKKTNAPIILRHKTPPSLPLFTTIKPT